MRWGGGGGCLCLVYYVLRYLRVISSALPFKAFNFPYNTCYEERISIVFTKSRRACDRHIVYICEHPPPVSPINRKTLNRGNIRRVWEARCTKRHTDRLRSAELWGWSVPPSGTYWYWGFCVTDYMHGQPCAAKDDLSSVAAIIYAFLKSRTQTPKMKMKKKKEKEPSHTNP